MNRTEALIKSRDMWRYLARTGCDKQDYLPSQEWLHLCALCEWAHADTNGCSRCPFPGVDDYRCGHKPNPYHDWILAKTDTQRKEAAQRMVDLLEQLITGNDERNLIVKLPEMHYIGITPEEAIKFARNDSDMTAWKLVEVPFDDGMLIGVMHPHDSHELKDHIRYLGRD